MTSRVVGVISSLAIGIAAPASAQTLYPAAGATRVNPDVLLRLDFHPAPVLLGFVLGPRFEENFRRALLISRGDLTTFIDRPISAFFLLICIVLIGAQIFVWLRKPKIVQEEKAIENQVSNTAYSELAE